MRVTADYIGWRIYWGNAADDPVDKKVCQW